MYLGRAAQVVLFMVVWAAALVAVDKSLNHAPPKVIAVSGEGKPQVVVTFTHFCCTGCYDKMFSAAKSLSWIVTATTDSGGLKKQEDMQIEKVDPAIAIDTMWQKDATLLLDETDIKSVDFQKVDQTFRDSGLVPGHMVLENIPHFRLIAVDPHLCCGICEGSATNAIKQEQARAQTHAKIEDPSLSASMISTQVMPMVSVDRPKQTVTAEYYQRADVSGFRDALERAGFSPKEIRIEVL